MSRAIPNRITKLVKQNADIKESLEKLMTEYDERMAGIDIKLQYQRDKLKTRLSEREKASHDILCELLGTKKPLSILVRLFNTEQTKTGWRVLSSDKETWYEIPEDLSQCPCPFRSATERCSHIRAVQILTRLKFKKVTST